MPVVDGVRLRLTWTQAKDHCADAIGGFIATVRDDYHVAEILDEANTMGLNDTGLHAWIGGRHRPDRFCGPNGTEVVDPTACSGEKEWRWWGDGVHRPRDDGGVRSSARPRMILPAHILGSGDVAGRRCTSAQRGACFRVDPISSVLLRTASCGTGLLAPGTAATRSCEVE